ncbi:hypothetical protein TNIN_196471 [Trichonephila inaurata madagascariensis]|uniref:Uncharacterized protein n=1 Tax=Trichonephila inaurata madagascariensis TaxID=2747483 RepID=A0A8X6XP29_9ARAC|nr:hypothetical protein TNIN_196471 [Trichonephila inaurata madagascariensis]
MAALARWRNNRRKCPIVTIRTHCSIMGQLLRLRKATFRLSTTRAPPTFVPVNGFKVKVENWVEKLLEIYAEVF